VFSEWLADPRIQQRLVMMDRVVDSIPHLDGVGLMATFLDRAL
jgi:hypothetical protein